MQFGKLSDTKVPKLQSLNTKGQDLGFKRMRDCSEGTDAALGQLVLVTAGGKAAGSQLDVSN